MTIEELSVGRKVINGLQHAAKPALELARNLSDESRKKMSIALTEMVGMIRALNTMDPEQRERIISELVNEMQKIRKSVEETGSIN